MEAASPSGTDGSTERSASRMGAKNCAGAAAVRTNRKTVRSCLSVNGEYIASSGPASPE
jgi:hypothetical protein